MYQSLTTKIEIDDRIIEVDYDLDEDCDDYGHVYQIAYINAIWYKEKRVDLIYPDFAEYHRLEKDLVDDEIVYDYSCDLKSQSYYF